MYRTALAAAAAAALTVTVLTVGPSAAGASDTAECTAWASMPTTVSVTSRQTVVHATLTGDSGCHAEAFENGATATLYGPGGETPYFQSWPHFGTVESIDVVLGVTRPGTYTMSHGDVQLYDQNSVRVPSQWLSTTMTIKGGARTSVARHATSVTGRARHFTDDGWVGSNGVPVSLQKRTASGWHTVATVRAGGSGRFTLHGRTTGSGTYRVVTSETTDYWSATAIVR